MQDTIERQKLSTGAAYEFVAGPVSTKTNPTWPAVVVVHGWRGSVFTSTTTRALVHELGRAGYHCLLLSLRGHQGSDGDIITATRVDHLADLRAAIEHLEQMPEVDKDKICLHGTSYGAYLISLLLAEKTIKPKLVGMCVPALYPDGDFDQPVAQMADKADIAWRRRMHSAADVRALMGVLRFEGCLFVASARRDEYMPPEVVWNYQEAARHAKHVDYAVVDSTHVLSGLAREEYINRAAQFYKTYYPATNTAPTA